MNAKTLNITAGLLTGAAALFLTNPLQSAGADPVALQPILPSSVEVTAPAVVSSLVQASSLAQASEAVNAVGGTITHELGVINAVGARLTGSQRDALQSMPAAMRLEV